MGLFEVLARVVCVQFTREGSLVEVQCLVRELSRNGCQASACAVPGIACALMCSNSHTARFRSAIVLVESTKVGAWEPEAWQAEVGR